MVNMILLLIIAACIFFFNNDVDNSYLQFGPNEKLIIMGIRIDNWNKYIILNIIITVI